MDVGIDQVWEGFPECVPEQRGARPPGQHFSLGVEVAELSVRREDEDRLAAALQQAGELGRERRRRIARDGAEGRVTLLGPGHSAACSSVGASVRP